MEQQDFISEKTMKDLDIISDEINNPCPIGAITLCNVDLDDMFVVVVS